MHIDIQEAARLTGKNDATIRRLTKKPVSEPHVKTSEGKIYIEQDYLFSNYPPIQPVSEPMHLHMQAPTQAPDNSLLDAKDETIRILRQDVEGKEKVINQLLERTREQNIIIQSIQEKMRTLPASVESRNIEQSGGYSGFEKGAFFCLLAVILSLLYFLFFS